MIIAMWDYRRKEWTQTDDTASISVMMALMSRKRIVMLENGYQDRPLEQVFRGIQRFYYVKEDSNYFEHYNGMDVLLSNLYHEQKEPVLLRGEVEVIKNYLYYVPRSRVINHMAYEYELYHQMNDIVDLYSKRSDYTMIKTMKGSNLTTQRILRDSDLIIVSLDQNLDVLEEFFENYSAISSKSIFLFNEYQSKILSVTKIMKKYHLAKENVAVISKHLPMYEAYLNGSLVNFIKSNYNCPPECEHYRCIRELRRIVRLIMKAERGEALAKTAT